MPTAKIARKPYFCLVFYVFQRFFFEPEIRLVKNPQEVKVKTSYPFLTNLASVATLNAPIFS